MPTPAIGLPVTGESATSSRTRTGVEHLLAAIESRDIRAVEAALAPDASWQNVPGPAAVGRPAVLAMLAGILCWSDEVGWDVVSAAYDGDLAHLERVDRFDIAGTEHAVRCNGVFRVDDAGLVTEVRDYVDVAEWRARVGPVLAHMAAQPAEAVVRRHLDAVARRDVVAMASDYALDAELVRAGDRHRGLVAITDYFATVPDRLAGLQLDFAAIESLGDDTVATSWTLRTGAASADTRDGLGSVVASGHDEFVVDAGRIVAQTVVLDGDDF